MGPGNEHKHTVSFHSKYSRISEGEELLRGYNVKTHHKQPKTDAYHRRTRRPTNTILSKPTKNQGSNFLSTTSQNLYALRSTRDSRTRKVISFVLQNHNKYWFVIFLLKMKAWRDTIELAFFWWSKMVLVEIFGLLNRKISPGSFHPLWVQVLRPERRFMEDHWHRSVLNFWQRAFGQVHRFI